jgi:chitinase
MDLTLSGKFQAETVLAKWDTQLAFPDQSSTEDPQDLENPSQDGTQDVGTTKIDYSIAANGQITAHIKPMVSFGIEFNQKFISIDPATVSLVADGYVQLYASATYSSTTTEVCYGANAGADLYAQLSVPSSIGWLLPGGVSQYSLYSLPAVGIIERTCPISSRDLSELDYPNSTAYLELPEDVTTRYSQALSKRSTTVGPLIHIPQLSCPSSEDDETGSSNISTCPLCLDEDDDELDLYPRAFADLRSRADSCLLPSSYGDPTEDSCSPSSLSARSWYGYWDGAGNQTHILQPRFDPKVVQITLGGTQYTIDLGTYPACGEASGRSNVAKYYTYPLQKSPCTADISRVSKAQLDSISSFQSKFRSFLILLPSVPSIRDIVSLADVGMGDAPANALGHSLKNNVLK